MTAKAIATAAIVLMIPFQVHAGTRNTDHCPADDAPQTPTSPDAISKAQALRDDLSRRAAHGFADSMVDLATLEEQGDAAAKPDRAAALDLYEKAAATGNQIGREKTCIAYLLGEGRPRDPVKGMAVCAELPHNNAVFMFAGAYDYQNGLSGPKDEDTARNLYALATKAGSGEAADAMGQDLLAQGKADMARQWFRRGVYLGSPDAMDHLAQMVEAGQGGPADADEAGWLYEHAALRGNVHAQGQPKSMRLLSACMADNGAEMAITHTYSDKSGPHTETVTLDRLISLMTRSFATWVSEATIEGSATIICHIAADHTLDACILEREYPQRAGYGQTLEAIFNGHMSVADQDARGRPTAHRRLALAVNWKVSH